MWADDVPKDATTVDIKCENTADYGGLIASFANGLIGDDDWKCAHNATQIYLGLNQVTMTVIGIVHWC